MYMLVTSYQRMSLICCIPHKSSYRKLFRRWEGGMGELRDLAKPLPTLLPAVLTGVAHSLKSRTLASACRVVE
jgi:hypothetical protein